MKKLTKLIFAGFLALAIAPVVALSLNEVEEPVEVKADSGETRVYNVTDLKNSLEDNVHSKIILDDELMIRPDVDPRPEVIYNAPSGYSTMPFITITGTKELVLAGDCMFEQSKSSGQVTFNRFIKILGGNLTITGAGTLGFKFSGAATTYNTVIEVDNGGQLKVDSSFVTIKGDVKAKTSCSTIYVSENGNAELNGGKITSVHSANVAAADSNKYTVYTKYNEKYNGGLKLSGNIEIDYEQTNIDSNSVAGLAWSYPTYQANRFVASCTVNKVHEDLGASFAACFSNNQIKAYDASGVETNNFNQKIIVKEQSHTVTKQPTGGTTKIGQSYKFDYALDFEPEQIYIKRFKTENYDYDQIGQGYAWHNWGDTEEITNKVIKAKSSSLTLEGKQFFKLTFIYTDNYQRSLDSNIFIVNFDPYTITFDANGGTGTMDPVTYNGEVYNLPYCRFTAPANMAFSHWEINGEAKKPLYDVHANGDIVVKAIWRNMDWKFTVQPIDQVVSVGYGTACVWDGNFADYATIKLMKLVGSNWEMVWEDNVQDAHSDIIPKQDSPINIKFRLDVYASDVLKRSSDEFTIHWKSGEIDQYEISFDAGEGTGTMESLLVNENEQIILPFGTFEAPEDKVFVGWALDDDSASSVDYEVGSKFLVDNVHTFYAVYDRGATISFDSNSGTGEMENIENYFGEYIVPECEYEAPEGTYFFSWELDDSTVLFPGDKIMVFGDVTLTAQWSDYRYNVFYNANGGSGEMAPELNHGINFIAPACTFNAPDEHHQFSYWAINSSDGVRVEQEANITLEENVTFYAVWELKQYNVIYNAGEASSLEGNGNVIKSNIEATSIINLESSILFKNPQGKHFKEWAINTASGEKINAGAQYTLNGNVTFIAIWEVDASSEGLDDAVNMYSVSFNANGGSGAMNDEGVEEGAQYALPACTFTAPTNKAFAGWKVNGQGDLLQAGATITINANVELVAEWKDAEQQGGETPSDGGDTTPTDGGNSSSGKKKCGGSIVTTSVVLSIVALTGAGLVLIKRKEK